MRFLLDTNILIPLEDSHVPLPEGLANFVRLAQAYGHPLVVHPASEDDLTHDQNANRGARTRARLEQYSRLDSIPDCPWNSSATDSHDAADNAILYALYCDAAHYLVTEDKGIHKNAVSRGLGDRVYAIKAAEDFLRRLHEPTSVHLPNIQDVPLHSLTRLLNDEFFDSLREEYPEFDTWFRSCARNDRRAWVYWIDSNKLGALCIYARKENDDATGQGDILFGALLKLCTFKVAPSCRGRKIGELFLKAAFRYATENRLENIYIHGNPDKQNILFELLADFGFSEFGRYDDDVVYVKRHPISPPDNSLTDLPAFEYFRNYFPHFCHDRSIRKFIIPIRPEYHRILFSDYISSAEPPQMALFDSPHTASNAIKQAYLCRAQLGQMNPGDVVLFYRSTDERAVTSLGIVEEYITLQDVNEIVDRVRRRTVYSMDQITAMAAKPIKVMLFRLIKHFSCPPSGEWLNRNRIVNGNIQTIREIDDDAFERLVSEAS
ncbi:N-acetyltransferase [Nitrosospira lacus]|uniref:N-acetyltransferase n=1 Tax=Nitrosospira lacus TaxID=1288494 RepID=A0A1W6SSI0_9PROT|nr:GNAT family N-acetyltransferase [Nitrosospira lacus]ARO88762.1 N-acetyltransferase [Nitrosospira lacus]